MPKAALQPTDANVTDAAPPAASKAAASKKGTIEETYQKLTQHQHILQRPDTYVGSIEPVSTDMWVMDSESGKMVNRNITYVPALYKIFDEIVVNAADNKQRDANMTELRIDIDKEKNRLSVYNNGQGIPVVMHKEHGIYVPELIFGTRHAPLHAYPFHRRHRRHRVRSADVAHSCLPLRAQATCSRAPTLTTTRRRRRAGATATARSSPTSSRPSSPSRRPTVRAVHACICPVSGPSDTQAPGAPMRLTCLASRVRRVAQPTRARSSSRCSRTI